MAAEITQEEPKTREVYMLAKTLVDLLVIHRDMPSTLAAVILQLNVFKI